MTKQEVQQRVIKDGSTLDLDKFIWYDETRTFSSNKDLILK